MGTAKRDHYSMRLPRACSRVTVPRQRLRNGQLAATTYGVQESRCRVSEKAFRSDAQHVEIWRVLPRRSGKTGCVTVFGNVAYGGCSKIILSSDRKRTRLNYSH